MKKFNLILTLCLFGICLTVNAQEFEAFYQLDRYGETRDFDVAVSANGFTNIASIQFSMNWNPEDLTFIGVGGFNANLNLDTTFFGTENQEEGKLGFSWFALNQLSLPDSSTLFKIRFEPGRQLDSCTTLQFGNEPIPIEVATPTVALNFNGTILEVCREVISSRFDEPDMSGIDFLQISPNPFLGSGILQFRLERPGEYELSMVDLSGKPAFHQKRFFSEGLHSIQVTGVKPGIFMITLRSDNHFASLKVVSMD